ncbi:MAG: hypothetical protein ACRD44_07085 [Bryobacteraceae bacterium]
MIRAAILTLLCATAQAELLRLEFTLTGVNCVSCFESLPSRLGRVRGVDSVEVNLEKSTVKMALARGNRIRLMLLRDTLQQDGTKVVAVRLEAEGGVGRDNGRWVFTPGPAGEQFLLPAAEKSIESASVTGTIREFPPNPEPWTIRAEVVRPRQ